MSTTEVGIKSDDDSHTAFFYGTLMAPEVFFTVCYRFSPIDVATLKSLHTFQPALLEGYCRRRVKYADYPGITPDPQHSVRGVYVTGLTGANMDKLTTFEGSEYDIVKVKVKLLDNSSPQQQEGSSESNKKGDGGGEEKEAQVYVFNAPQNLEDREWDFDEFRTQKMKKWTREDYGFDDADAFTPVE